MLAFEWEIIPILPYKCGISFKESKTKITITVTDIIYDMHSTAFERGTSAYITRKRKEQDLKKLIKICHAITREVIFTG